MQSNLSLSNANVAFQARVDGKLLDAADAYYSKLNSPKKYKQFCSAVRRFSEIPNSDSIEISYSTAFKDGQKQHLLCAYSEEMGNVVLSAKDQFRKLLEKFSYMNEYEFKLKTGLIKK